MIIKAIPAAEPLYEMVGLGLAPLGEGLELKVKKSSFETIDDKNYLVVVGSIKNITEDIKNVPLLRISLYNTENEIVQTLDLPSKRNKLEPGRRSSFKAKIEAPSELARRAEVTFTDGKTKAKNEEEKSAPK